MPQRIAVFLARRHIIPANVDAIVLRIVAKADAGSANKRPPQE
jgi:hypothetical protein